MKFTTREKFVKTIFESFCKEDFADRSRDTKITTSAGNFGTGREMLNAAARGAGAFSWANREQ
jgi:hypothetical protein